MNRQRSRDLEGARFVDHTDDLEVVVDELVRQPRYGLDTEFHRERTYFPRLALVQLAWDDEIALVDPLAVDVKPLIRLFESPALCVVHAAQQDLDVLGHAVGAAPGKIFDTQLAAGFLGYSTPSLLALLQGELGVTPAKGDRLTDWLRRPLSASQRIYAAADVAWLLELHDRLESQLAERGRLNWVVEACEELRTRQYGGAHPDDAWLRLKDGRNLRPRARAVAQSVARWREEAAARFDVPVRQILPDLAVLGVAQRQPTTSDDLLQARGCDERHARGRTAREILDAVEIGLAAEPPTPPDAGLELDRSLRPAVTLVSALISQVAKQEQIETSLLATRADIVATLRGDDDARLRSGWRHDLVGGSIDRLITGKAGMTFDGSGGLRLVDFS